MEPMVEGPPTLIHREAHVIDLAQGIGTASAGTFQQGGDDLSTIHGPAAYSVDDTSHATFTTNQSLQSQVTQEVVQLLEEMFNTKLRNFMLSIQAMLTTYPGASPPLTINTLVTAMTMTSLTQSNLSTTASPPPVQMDCDISEPPPHLPPPLPPRRLKEPPNQH